MFLRLAFLLALLPLMLVNVTSAAQEKEPEKATVPTTALPAESYAVPTWANLIRTMARFGALDFSDSRLVDDYAIIAECDLYESFFHNDFKWMEIQNSLRESLQTNLGSYPIAYQYDLSLPLDRYDFKNKIFRFKEKDALKGVNTIYLLSSGKSDCAKTPVSLLPYTFIAVFPTPSSVEGLRLSETEAKALLFRMENEGNTERRVFIRYTFRIAFIEPFKKILKEEKSLERVFIYRQYDKPKHEEKTARFDAQLDSIAIYEDEDRTKLLYLYNN